MNANVLGREANDKPEDTLADLPMPLVPMNEGKGLDLTVASKKDSFFKRGDPAINADGASGPKGPLTMPGGNDMIAEGYKPSVGQHMQVAKEGTDSYTGNDVRGKVLKAAKISTGTVYEN